MSSRNASPPVDPVAGAAALLARVALAILLIGAPIASVATRQAVYALVPVGAALTLVAWLMEPDMRGPRRLRDACSRRPGIGVLFLASLGGAVAAVDALRRRTVRTVREIRDDRRARRRVAIAFMPERTKTSNLYLLPIGAMAGALAIVAGRARAAGVRRRRRSN